MDFGLVAAGASAFPTVTYIVFRVVNLKDKSDEAELTVRSDQAEPQKIQDFLFSSPDSPVLHGLLIGVCFAALSQTGVADIGPQMSMPERVI